MILETERLILRPFTENDAANSFEYLHEPMVHCFACMKPETMEDARKAVLDRAKDGKEYKLQTKDLCAQARKADIDFKRNS